MLRALLELFVLYLLYKVIFDFIIPIYKTTKQVKHKVNEMQHTMNEQAKRQRQQSQYTAAANQPSPKPKSDDYIDFEEVK
jgi:predicted Holliday junction resolvase-like endonuclease